MMLETPLDAILDTGSKVRILRLFMTRTDVFLASGREIARSTSLSPPAAHSALKDLLDRGLLAREIIGRQHLYRLNSANRIVRDLLRPLFLKERGLKQDIRAFLLRKLQASGLVGGVVSLVLYGSLASGRTHEASDCDLAVVAADSSAKFALDLFFTESLAPLFHAEFGFHVDPYIKTVAEFRRKLLRNEAPVSTLAANYETLHGKDPMDLM
jgi:predicted nucleotidyltransferase/predicted DNA-binding transcriptional regulator